MQSFECHTYSLGDACASVLPALAQVLLGMVVWGVQRYFSPDKQHTVYVDMKNGDT